MGGYFKYTANLMYTTTQFPLVRLASARAEGGVRGMKKGDNYYTESHRESTTLTLKSFSVGTENHGGICRNHLFITKTRSIPRKVPSAGGGAVVLCGGRGG